jgi:2-(1,2-epoxy-1,2-dihydrophenyl)acetyl-CoA isomerase
MSLTESRTAGLRDQTGEELVVVEQDGTQAKVTLNDPVTLNALSEPLTATLYRRLQQLVEAPELRTIVLTGAEGAFSSGAGYLDAVPGVSRSSVEASAGALRWKLGQIVTLMARSDLTFVAAVDGLAAGAGLVLALACDVAIVSDQARLAPAADRVGLLSEVGMGWLLTRRLGYQRTLSLFTQGYELSPAEAVGAGLVEAAVDHDELPAAVSFWCAIADLAATREMAKPLVRSATESGHERATVMGEFIHPALPAGRQAVLAGQGAPA